MIFSFFKAVSAVLTQICLAGLVLGNFSGCEACLRSTSWSLSEALDDLALSSVSEIVLINRALYQLRGLELLGRLLLDLGHSVDNVVRLVDIVNGRLVNIGNTRRALG